MSSLAGSRGGGGTNVDDLHDDASGNEDDDEIDDDEDDDIDDDGSSDDDDDDDDGSSDEDSSSGSDMDDDEFWTTLRDHRAQEFTTSLLGKVRSSASYKEFWNSRFRYNRDAIITEEGRGYTFKLDYFDRVRACDGMLDVLVNEVLPIKRNVKKFVVDLGWVYPFIKDDERNYHEALTRLSNALALMPSLKTLEIKKHATLAGPSDTNDVGCIGAGILLQNMTQVTDLICISCSSMNHLSNVITNHPNLQNIHFDCCVQNHDQQFMTALGAVPKLSKLRLTSSDTEATSSILPPQFFSSLLLRKPQTLTFLELKEFNLSIDQDFNDFCFALGRNESFAPLFDTLELNICKLPLHFSVAFADAVERNKTLRCLLLRFARQSSNVFTMSGGTLLGAALGSHTNLRSVSIDLAPMITERPIPDETLEQMSQFLEGLTRNKSIQNLELKMFQVQPILRFFKSYRNNDQSSLQSLRLRLNCVDVHKPAWKEVIKCFKHVNLSVSEFHIKLVLWDIYGDGPHVREMENNAAQDCNFLLGIMAMNRAGRRYFLGDCNNKKKGLRVLASVHQSLDCIYLHLRENPSLCC